MKVDGALVNVTLADVPARARDLEASSYDGLYTFEGPHDPFFPLLLAAEHTERVELTTAIAIAFARSPMNLAHIGDDLQRASAGRFVLGLGTQVKPHIEKRFSMPWSSPVDRMRELVLAVRAIWASWHDQLRRCAATDTGCDHGLQHNSGLPFPPPGGRAAHPCHYPVEAL
jgi:probable F420-dependent oxidoreductase